MVLRVLLGVLLGLGVAAASEQPAGERGGLVVDPSRPVVEITRTSFTVEYFTRQPCQSRVQVREGPGPMVRWLPEGGERADVWSGPSARVVEGGDGPATVHRVRVDGLRPGWRYYYRIFDPGITPTAEESAWGASEPWRRELAVSTVAPVGMKTVIRYPVKVLLMPNVVNVASAHDESGAVIADRPTRLTEQQLALIRSEYASASRFFWVNSGMRFWVDFQFFVDDRWQRWGPEQDVGDAFYAGWPVCRSYAGVDYRGPGGGAFTIVDTRDPTRVATEPVYEDEPYPAQIEQAFVRRWNATTKQWEFYNSGGGTFGLDGYPRGIPGRSQFLGGGDTAWLTCHEFHHQMESLGWYSLSRREDERIVFNHYAPRQRVRDEDGSVRERTWTSNGPHGEHWDGMAYWDRTLSDAQWLRLYLGETITVADGDGDGFPDNDARLPLDETRFGSDPTRSMTDGRMNDLDKARLSTWAPAPLQPSWTKPGFAEARGASRPDPTKADSDGDGLADGLDSEPLCPWPAVVWPMRAKIDGLADDWTGIPVGGRIDAAGTTLTFRQGHDEGGYFGLFEIDGPWSEVRAVFDGEGLGVYSGRGVQGFVVRNDGESVGVRPIFGDAPGLRWAVNQESEHRTVFEFRFPNRGEGIWFWKGGGRPIGSAIELQLPASGGGGRYSIAEPYHLFVAKMLETWGQPEMPPEPPEELATRDADLVLGPESDRLKLSGDGWQRQAWALRHHGAGESVAYVDGLAAHDFDFWVRIEAKSDAVLGAYTVGQERMSAAFDYVAFVGGYENTRTHLRLFGREQGQSGVVMTPGEHTMQLTRRDGELWVLFDGEPILWADDPQPDRVIDRLAVIGGYGGDQVLHEVRIRLPRKNVLDEETRPDGAPDH